MYFYTIGPKGPPMPCGCNLVKDFYKENIRAKKSIFLGIGGGLLKLIFQNVPKKRVHPA